MENCAPVSVVELVEIAELREVTEAEIEIEVKIVDEADDGDTVVKVLDVKVEDDDTAVIALEVTIDDGDTVVEALRVAVEDDDTKVEELEVVVEEAVIDVVGAAIQPPWSSPIPFSHWQVDEHPSPFMVLPSSHISVAGSQIPSPHATG